ncbi:MAG: hypothetical protein HOB79_17920 [Rhodospirillaceae bacterium]|jgi:hypothetical protein|nr:hypothetical protein [Rhodospirillales bacterium]MBT3904026.1 hypothetical protein [Rhodospirillaceae bacterium]MBT4702953.1 hypothetical protein [Rhodospirillaceae bacterium]MBT5036513.1 hypothetical protein [Rhodospirillaceae bacterium]MBT6218238.1 hypothetical protein [Rhodospirillaceae bacterium]
MNWNGIVGAVACMAGLLSAGIAGAQSSSGAATPSARPTAQVTQYTHPVRKFIIAVPPGEKVVPRGKRQDLMIRSRRGYVVSIQTDDRNRTIDLKHMIGKLESQEMGKGKRWSHKIGERFINVGGLPAYDAIYEGSNIRTRTVIVRGAITDFVIMFVAAPRTFPSLSNIFDWVVENFHPAPPELAGVPKPSAQAMAPRNSKAPVMAQANPPAQAALKHYGGPLEGYSLKYPGTWVASNPNPSTVYFSGPKGADTYYTLIGVRSLRPKAKGPDDAVRKVLTTIKSEIKGAAKNLKSLGEVPYRFKGKGFSLLGREIILTYHLHDQEYKKWTLVLPSGVGDTVLAWSFTAPAYLFEKHLPMARKVKDSWYIHAPRK